MSMEEGFIVVNKGSEDNQIELNDLPPGFRFHPTDEEIITYYLIQKVVNGDFTASAIGEADLNKCEPWDLPKKAKMGEKEWYFFCQRDRKYPTGIRTNRATESGYWKATGKDREIHKGKGSSCLVGMKKTLVFYIGRAPKGEKTNWVMHEYRLEGKFSHYNLPKSAKDEWVVCRVFHKNTGNNNNNKKTIIPEIQGLLRINSFGVDDILNCSNSLPPLTDDPPYDYNIYSNVDNKTPLTRSLNSTCPDQPNSKFYYSINVDPSNILHPYQHQINPHSYFPDNNHNNKALMGYYFPKGIILGNSGSVAFDDHHIKAEVSNQSACMISLSQDTTEISSVVSKEEIPSVSNDNNNNKKPTISLYGRGFDFEGPSSSLRPNPISDLQGSVWDDL